MTTKLNKKVYLEIRRRVFIGMSGGVDSSVSAALLKQAGFDVTGVFIRVWEPKGYPCTWRDERQEAMRVAAHLDIPLVTWNFAKEYKQAVVDYMVSEYKAGRTPNPDVMCNKHIKFGIFYNTAIKKGADFVATGHYAINDKKGFKISNDTNKDQTYFLWNLKTKQLPHILFPVGVYTKPEVRLLATEFDLPNAEKKDSQGLCFVGQFDFKAFLKKQIKPKKGSVINEKNEIIGHHDGVWFYTIGERHGFTVTKKTPNDQPYFIIAKDTKKNILTVSNNHKRIAEQVGDKKVIIEQTNWITETPKASKVYKARFRYRQPLQNCKVKIVNKNKAEITFSQSQTAVASGQSIVVYEGRNCLGGGIIK
ncbi:MAG: tRNA 2-thiouridine(34) synthase MnmA [bacterium]